MIVPGAQPGAPSRVRILNLLPSLAWLVPMISIPLLASCSTRQHPPKGVILIVVDTLRRDALGVHGGPPGITPNLDRWSEEGIRFDQAIAHASWTLPSTASILTGLFPAHHGASGSFSGEFRGVGDEVVTLAERLSTAGFRTHAVVNGTFASPKFGLDRGFEEYDFDTGSNNRIRRADKTLRAAIEWMSTLEEADRFLLYLHLFDPHLNYDPPPSTLGRFTGDYRGSLSPPFGELLSLRAGESALDAEDRRFARGLYYEEVAALDATIGVLDSWLESKGLDEEVLLIVTSDHGEEFWEHGGFEHGHTLYDELLRIPLIVRPPSGGSRGEVVGEQVTQADLVPTILRSLGLPIDAGLDGQPLLSDRFAPVPIDEATAAPTAGLLNSAQGSGKALRAEGWKAIFWDSGEWDLYDLRTDPEERNDLSAARGEVLQRLAERREDLLNPREGSPVSIDENTRDRLRALGYLE
ncbi:MAG: hypothetical protein CME06_01355 [Gemmatimonadetes bacterium]|nr:hypothetical protein [Gemmatimonadota bacterium]